MPTKAPEYMISGTPMIIFAPQETAIVQYAMKHDIGFIISENKINEIAASIRQLIDNKELRSRIGQKAIQIAELNHNSKNVNPSFQKPGLFGRLWHIRRRLYLLNNRQLNCNPPTCIK